MIKKLLNILFYVMIILVCIISILIKEDYSYLFNNVVVNNGDTFNEYKDSKFIKLDISRIEKTRFSIEENESENLNVSLIKINDKYVLLELTPSTVIESKIKLMKMNDDTISDDLKQTIESENKDIIFVDGYYTNKNLEINEKFIMIKLIVTGLFILISIIGIIISLFKRKKENYEL